MYKSGLLWKQGMANRPQQIRNNVHSNAVGYLLGNTVGICRRRWESWIRWSTEACSIQFATTTTKYCIKKKTHWNGNNQVRWIIEEGMLLLPAHHNISVCLGKQYKNAKARADGLTHFKRGRDVVVTQEIIDAIELVLPWEPYLPAYSLCTRTFPLRQRNIPMLYRTEGYGRTDKCTPHLYIHHVTYDCN